MNGIVYLVTEWVSDARRYKIGITKNKVLKRIKQLQTGNSNEISLVCFYESEHYKKIEKMLHKKYCGNNLMGEWFELPDEEVSKFTETCTQLNENIQYLKDHNHFFKK